MPSLIFRKGLDLKHAVAAEVAADYHSELVDRIKGSPHGYTSGRVTLYLAREFGFCYGVDRAIDYAYQTRRRFPDRPVYLTGEIIHNPHVNGKLRAAGIRFLSDPAEDADQLGREAVVILPAFGVEVAELEQYVRQGCTVIDTTCGSVLNVWKTVRQYAAGRIHDHHSWQGSPRGDTRHGLPDADDSAGALPGRARPRRSVDRLRLYPPRRRGTSVAGACREGGVGGLRSGP